MPDRARVVHIPAPAPGEGYAACTYAGDAATVVTSGQPVGVEVDAPWPELLTRIWDGLDPLLRVAAAVVPLTSDLRGGQFTGRHEPLILREATSRTEK